MSVLYNDVPERSINSQECKSFEIDACHYLFLNIPTEYTCWQRIYSNTVSMGKN